MSWKDDWAIPYVSCVEVVLEAPCSLLGWGPPACFPASGRAACFRVAGRGGISFSSSTIIALSSCCAMRSSYSFITCVTQCLVTRFMARSVPVSGSGCSSSSSCRHSHSSNSKSFLKTWVGFPAAYSSVFFTIAATLALSTIPSVRTRYAWRLSHLLSKSRSVGGGRFFFLSSAARKQ